MSRSVGHSMISGGALSLVRLATGVVRVKVVALALGVAGLGIYAIFAQLYLVGVALASMSLSTPIINLGRRPFVAGNFAEAGSIAGTALAVIAANCAIIAISVAVFGPPLLHYLGIAADAQGLLLPLAVAVLFGAVSGAFWEGLSFLCDRFDVYVRACMAAAVADMVFIAAGAWAFGLRGAIVALALGPLTMFITYWLLIGRDPRASQVLHHLSVRLARLSSLLTYSAVMLSAVALTNIGLTLLRSRVLVEAGAVANGYLQTVTSLAAYVLAFVMTGFWGHMYARAAAVGDTPEVRAEFDRALRLGALIAFTGCGIAAVLADLIIPLFYSGEFRPAAQMLTAYMPGEFCFQLLSMLTAYQITVSLRRRYLALSLGYIAILVGAGIFLIPAWGGLGYVAGHNIASLVMVVAALGICWRKGQIGGRFLLTLFALAMSLVLICALAFYLREAGYGAPYMLPALLPFVISGCIVLFRLWRERPANQPQAVS